MTNSTGGLDGAALAAERKALFGDLRRRLRWDLDAADQEVFARLDDAALERAVLSVLRGRLRSLDDASARALARAAGRHATVCLRSACRPDLQERLAFDHALRERLQRPVTVDWQEAHLAMFGVELVIGSERLCWYFDDYAPELREELRQRLGALPAAS